MGISKKSFMEDYYLDEFLEIVKQHNAISTPNTKKEDEAVFIDQIFKKR